MFIAVLGVIYALIFAFDFRQIKQRDKKKTAIYFAVCVIALLLLGWVWLVIN